jgi:16S rRNA (cytosine1402-N4)-methyltransferase
MDVDPVAHAKARAHIDALLQSTRSSLKPHLLFKNFKYIKSVVGEIDDDCKLLSSGVDGILMDLGMSSMQVYLTHPISYFLIFYNLTTFYLFLC